MFPDGKLDTSKKKIDWEAIAVKGGVKKDTLEMRWSRFKKRNMKDGTWVTTEATTGGAKVKEDVGDVNDDEDATPSKKRKKNTVSKKAKKDDKEEIIEADQKEGEKGTEA